MAKQAIKNGGMARIRLVVLDAEIPEGDVAQLTQALQNALRPAPSAIFSRNGGTSPQIPPAFDAASENTSLEDIEGETDLNTRPAKPKGETKPRRQTTPKLIDLTPEQVASWKAFASAKVPRNDSDKYVLAVAWFKENGADEGVTADHVFTCFRQMKWSVAIDDFGALMRSLKASNHFKSLDRGKYAVTQIGLQRIDDMETVVGAA